MYDIIGDIHGFATKLVDMLKRLGYSKDLVGTFFHPTRKAIFIGDFVNKGPEIKRTVGIVRSMVESGYAKAILGNHELMMLQGNQQSYYSTLASYEKDPEQLESDRKWLLTLPLFLNLDGCRVVHAFWHDQAIQTILNHTNNGVLKKRFFDPNHPNHKLNDAVRLISQGLYYMPEGKEEIVQKGVATKAIRTRWWQLNLNLYAPQNPPVFFGHYCLDGEPELIAENVCCLDYCTYLTGRLTAYSWDGEQVLDLDKLTIVI